MLAPGVLITPNISLVRLLGQGGMGSVWLADHLTLHTQVAVKFISAQFVDSADAVSRFSREATAAAKIKSPYVVQILDHGVFDGLPYIVMELLEGEDLEQRIDRAGPLALGEVGEILQQMGRALAQAHGLGIVHRDIKPANVFLTIAGGDLVVKLLDFGIAKSDSSPGSESYKTTRTGQIMGTPCYLSPEQVFSKGKLDHRTDLWALAVLTYEAITGDVPFQGGTLGDIFVAIHQRVFEPVRVKTPSLPPELDAWFDRAFAANPDARFASARELADAFLVIARAAPDARATPSAAAASAPGLGASGPAPALTGQASVGALSTPNATLGPVATAAVVAPPKKGRAPLVIGAVAGALVSLAVVAVVVSRGGHDAPVPSPAAVAPAPSTTAEALPVTASVTVTPAPPAAPTVVPSATADATPSATSTARPASTDAHTRNEQRPAATAKPAATGVKRHDHGF